MDTDQFQHLFPAFRTAPQAAREIMTAGSVVSFPADKLLYRDGDVCEGIGLLLAGEIRVYKVSAGGREITLYDIFPGESCILNASSILSHSRYPAQALSTVGGRMLYLPQSAFRRLMNRSDVLRAFIFRLFSQRLAEVIELVEAVAFGRLDQRLADYLLEKSENGRLETTHQKIANDLGSSREVISRLLKDLQRRGEIALARNRIRLLTF